MTARSTAAPGRLDTVRSLVNTLDLEASTDVLATPADLSGWLTQASLAPVGTTCGPADLARAVALREALRSALGANHSAEPVPVDAVAVLNDTAERAALSLALTSASGWVARPRADGVDGALGALLVIVADAMSDGTWPRLKVCVNDTCRWAFYDQSRARSGKWCSMQVCGNRAKQQAWRSRHDAGQSD